MALYLRALSQIDASESAFVSSQELAAKVGVTAAQVRKDLAMFGEFGKQGVGYHAGFLREEIARILKADRTIEFVIIGAGELGIALGRYTLRKYESEQAYPFMLTAMFDIDPAKVGHKVAGISVRHISEMARIVNERCIGMALLTVPESAAQSVIDLLGETRIKAVLNFAPTRLVAPRGIRVHNADVSLDLHHLAFFL